MYPRDEGAVVNIKEWVRDNTIHRIVAGSRLYGTARPDSDMDIRGVCLAPVETLIGLSQFKQYQKENADWVIYELRRFCSLALNANPNILDLLMAPKSSWQILDSRWETIYKNRSAFLSQKVRHTFSGYAVSQLKRIQRHRRWLIDPPDHKPSQEEFDGAWDGSTYQFPKVAREKEYRAACTKWKNYQRWLKERNPKRAELERKFGYDTKHTSHLVRLMLQCTRLLRTGTYNPRLANEDLKMVLAVLGGDWEYEVLAHWAEDMDKRVHEMDSVLPSRPNRRLIERLCITIYLNELVEQKKSYVTDAELT